MRLAFASAVRADAFEFAAVCAEVQEVVVLADQKEHTLSALPPPSFHVRFSSHPM